jgi:hypothetical protein
LEGLNATSAKRTTISKAVNRKGDWQIYVASSQEVPVQRVGWPVIRNGSLGCNEALRQHLSAENTTVRHPLGWAGKDVFGSSSATRVRQTESI